MRIETEAYLMLEGRCNQRIDQRLQDRLNNRATDAAASSDSEVCSRIFSVSVKSTK